MTAAPGRRPATAACALLAALACALFACSSSSSPETNAADSSVDETITCDPYRVNCEPVDAGADAVGCPGDAIGVDAIYPRGCTYDTVFSSGGGCTVDHQFTCDDAGRWQLTGI